MMAMQFAGKRYWLVGASEGLGLALAQALASEGAQVILSARDPARLAEACGKVARASAVVVDVAETASVAAAAQVGTVDGVVFLAGVQVLPDWLYYRVFAPNKAR